MSESEEVEAAAAGAAAETTVTFRRSNVMVPKLLTVMVVELSLRVSVGGCWLWSLLR